MTRAVIYTRFSPRPNSDDCDSCEKQSVRCANYCRMKGYTKCDYGYDDKAISGGDLNRPGLDSAIESLQDGDILVVDRPDRLARDSLVFLTIRHAVELRGARIEFADGTMPADSPEGRLMQSILAAFAAYERDRIRAWTKAGLARRKAKGVHLGRCPIGYKRGRGGKLVEDEDEQFAIVRILDHERGGLTPDRIAWSLNEYHGPIRGKPWTPRLVRRILERKVGAK